MLVDGFLRNIQGKSKKEGKRNLNMKLAFLITFIMDLNKVNSSRWENGIGIDYDCCFVWEG